MGPPTQTLTYCKPISWGCFFLLFVCGGTNGGLSLMVLTTHLQGRDKIGSSP